MLLVSPRARSLVFDHGARRTLQQLERRVQLIARRRRPVVHQPIGRQIQCLQRQGGEARRQGLQLVACRREHPQGRGEFADAGRQAEQRVAVELQRMKGLETEEMIITQPIKGV